MSLPVDKEPDHEAAVPYRGEQPFGVPEDLVIPGVLALDDDERLWVPQSREVYFRPATPLGQSGLLRRHSQGPPLRGCSPGTGTRGQSTPPLSGAVGIVLNTLVG